jgi:hypothetical protein
MLFIYSCRPYRITTAMPPKKRASNNLTRPKKRVKSSTARGTVSQPIPVNS